jgi:ribosomal protein S18 acetylase RimI-like enzyme
MEEQAPFGNPDYELPSYLEKVQSQLPALQLLMQMGWEYLTPDETVNLRGGRLGSAILEPILVDHIRNHCYYEFKGSTHPFTENAIQNAVQALKDFRATGATHQNEQAYDLLCLGTSVPQTVEGDTKSFTIDYFDWKNPERNTYHCTAEYKVERIGYQKHYVPDIVLFVNGKVVGFACAHDLGFRAYLSELIISKEFRNMGIGKDLIRRVEKELSERNCKILISDVWKDSVGFYRTLGWSEPDVKLLRKKL